MTGTRSKGKANLTNYTDDPEKIGKQRRRSTNKRITMVEPSNVVLPRPATKIAQTPTISDCSTPQMTCNSTKV